MKPKEFCLTFRPGPHKAEMEYLAARLGISVTAVLRLGIGALRRQLDAGMQITSDGEGHPVMTLIPPKEGR